MKPEQLRIGLDYRIEYPTYCGGRCVMYATFISVDYSQEGQIWYIFDLGDTDQNWLGYEDLLDSDIRVVELDRI